MVAAQDQLQKVLIGVGLAFALLLFAVLLGSVQVLALMGFMAIVWALTLPQHAFLALILGSVMMNASLLVPFVSGRPFFWEASLGLAISGLPLMFAMRKGAPDIGERIRYFKWTFVGLALFLVVIAALIRLRGFGLNVLGQGQIGGRAYITQFLGALFPFLYIAVPTDRKLLVRLYVAQCLMSVTFVVSDIALAAGTGPLWFLLSFFGLSTDSLAFEMQSLEGGIRRFQSIAFITRDLNYIILCLYPATRGLTGGSLGRALLILVLLSAGALGGHRISLLILPAVMILSGYAQRTLTLGKIFLGIALVAAGLSVAYGTARQLPYAAQRMISILPGIEVDPIAQIDADNTAIGRETMRRVAMDVMPNFLLIGRGLGYVPDLGGLYVHNELDTYGIVERNLESGAFYSGAPSLLVNLGIPGCIGVFLYLGSVTLFALKNLRFIRRHGCDSNFERVACHISALWLVQLVIFLTTTGDAGFLMTTFGLLSGLVLATHWHLVRRPQAEETPEAA
jgi:hypothetical protein